jgi:hypothetical protein
MQAPLHRSLDRRRKRNGAGLLVVFIHSLSFLFQNVVYNVSLRVRKLECCVTFLEPIVFMSLFLSVHNVLGIATAG